MRSTFCVSLLMIAVLALPTSLGETKMTLEEKFLTQLAFEIRMFEFNHGRALTNWHELEDYMVALNTELFRYKLSIYPFETHFVLLTNSVPMIDGAGTGYVRVIGIEPVKLPDRGEGRYVIHGDAKSFQRTRLPEQTVQEILRRASVTLPEPGVLPLLFPPREHHDDEVTRQAFEEEMRRAVTEDEAQQRTVERPVADPAERRIHKNQPPVAQPVQQTPPEAVGNLPIRWIGIGLVGLIGVGLIIVLFRARWKN